MRKDTLSSKIFLAQEELNRLLSAVDEVKVEVRRAEGGDPNDPFTIRNALGPARSVPRSD